MRFSNIETFTNGFAKFCRNDDLKRIYKGLIRKWTLNPTWNHLFKKVKTQRNKYLKTKHIILMEIMIALIYLRSVPLLNFLPENWGKTLMVKLGPV